MCLLRVFRVVLAILVAAAILLLFALATVFLPSDRLAFFVGSTLLLQQFATAGKFAASVLVDYPMLMDIFNFLVLTMIYLFTNLAPTHL